MPDNAAMLRRLRGRRVRASRARSTAASFEVTFPIAPTETYRERVDERDHVAVAASLRPFFEPRSVAVVGASQRRGTIGGELFRNILAGDFAGAAYPVNRDGEPVAGVRGYTVGRRDPRRRSTSRSSACPARTCSTRPRRRCEQACARSA